MQNEAQVPPNSQPGDPPEAKATPVPRTKSTENKKKSKESGENSTDPNKKPKKSKESSETVVKIKHARAKPSTKRAKRYHNSDDEGEEDYRNYGNDTPEIDHLVAEIKKEQYFQGCAPLEDLKDVLTEDGDFCVRLPDSTGSPTTSALNLAVRFQGSLIEVPFQFTPIPGSTEYSVTFDGNTRKPTIGQLLSHHVTQNIPIFFEGKDLKLVKQRSRPSWSLTKDLIEIEKEIGNGAFGKVYKGKLKPVPPQTEYRTVAVKVGNLSESQKIQIDDMIIEARLMRQFDHPNVVHFHGMVFEANEVMIVMEFVDGGSLDKHLLNVKEPLPRKLCFLLDIARGLEYLHQKQTSHRDVAARNCLISLSTGTIKIADFGMAKKGDYKILAVERCPIRWQAPEVLRTGVYTMKCDVYSFGMTAYEVLTDGKSPFHQFDNATVRRRIHDPGFRPRLPEITPPDLKILMKGIWRADPKARPSMPIVVLKIKQIIQKEHLKAQGVFIAESSQDDAKPKKSSEEKGTTSPKTKSPKGRGKKSKR